MRMFTRLFLLLGGLTAVSLAIVAGVLWRNAAALDRNLRTRNAQAGRRALTKGSSLLEDDLRTTHRRIVREKSKNLEAFFARIAATVRLDAALTSQFLADGGASGSDSARGLPPIYSDLEIDCHRDGEKDGDPFFQTTLGNQPYVMYHLAPNVEVAPLVEQAEVDDRLQRLRRLSGFFAETRRTLPGFISVYFGDSTGFILGYPGRGRFPPTYDPRGRTWYLKGIKRATGLVWEVGPDKDGQQLILTCASRVAQVPGGEPVGVAAVDVNLTEVYRELLNIGNLKVSAAVLLDDLQRVRVGANYDDYETAVVDKNLLRDPPPVAALPDRGFERVAALMRANPNTEAGAMWTGDSLDRSENVYVYSVVDLPAAGPTDAGTLPAPATTQTATTRTATTRTAPTGAAGGPSPERWSYIVRLPVDSVVQPIRAVSGEIDRATVETTTAIQSETDRSTTVVVLGIAAAFLASLVAAAVAARATANPLKQMAGVADAVGTGDLSQTAVETAGGEVGDLGRAINAMVRGLRERKLLEKERNLLKKERNLLKETFGRYVAPGVVDEVLARGDVQLGGVKRDVTVFFSDLMGFTSLSEKTAPEALVKLLNEYFEAMTGVILASEGTLDKYIGDAIMAFWGEPIAHDDDAARACRAALEQARRLEALSDGWQARGLEPLQMRVGIQTGPVVVGNVGSNLKLNYTALGDTVNLASRLESVNKTYGTRILIGEGTRQAAGGAVEVREVDRLAVVGKRESVRVYELLGMDGDVPAGRRAGYDAYEAGLAAYRGRRWDEAAAHFERAKAVLGGDRAADVLLERIGLYRNAPPPDDWDGTYVLDHK